MSEESWPELPILAPYETPEAPEFVGELVDMSDDLAIEEVPSFYQEFLIPQLSCAPNGEAPAHPQKNWLVSQSDPRQIVVIRADGEIYGAWILRNGGIYYPCAKHEFIAAAFRALWDETIKHFDYVWGDTTNPVIMAFAKKALRVPRSPNSPTVTDQRLEWRRDDAL